MLVSRETVEPIPGVLRQSRCGRSRRRPPGSPRQGQPTPVLPSHPHPLKTPINECFQPPLERQGHGLFILVAAVSPPETQLVSFSPSRSKPSRSSLLRVSTFCLTVRLQRAQENLHFHSTITPFFHTLYKQSGRFPQASGSPDSWPPGVLVLEDTGDHCTYTG